MMWKLCLSLLFCSHIFGDIDISWEYPDYPSCKSIFVNAFKECYKPFPPSTFDQPDFESVVQWLGSTFDDFYRKADPNSYWLTANEENQIIGFLMIEMEQFPKEIYLSFLAVHPRFQRKGAASAMLQAVIQRFPETEKLTLVTRIINRQAIAFYERFGFEKTDYMHEGYSSKAYVGLELYLGN